MRTPLVERFAIAVAQVLAPTFPPQAHAALVWEYAEAMVWEGSTERQMRRARSRVEASRSRSPVPVR
jgi:hypothetical protein